MSNHYEPKIFSITLLLLTLLCHILTNSQNQAFAAIVVPSYNVSFDSMPSYFGKPWSTTQQISAQLHFLSHQPLLCNENVFEYNNDNNENNRNNNDSGKQHYDVNNSNHTNSFLTKLPSNAPIALLVERGTCAFYEKARIASMIHPKIDYLIVYGYDLSTQQVPRSISIEPASSSIGLLFTSFQTGSELQTMIFNSANKSITITMDGTTPTLPPYSQFTITNSEPSAPTTDYLSAAFTGFVAFLICFTCVLLCAKAGWIQWIPDDNGRLTFFGSSDEPPRQLLTLPQVTCILSLHEYSCEIASCTTDSSACCSICLEELEECEQVCNLPCGHLFHQECIVPWLTERHSSCPLCKFNVYDHYHKQQRQKEMDNSKNDNDSNNTNQTGTRSSEQLSNNNNNNDNIPFWRRMVFVRQWTLVSNQEHDIDNDNSSLPITNSLNDEMIISGNIF